MSNSYYQKFYRSAGGYLKNPSRFTRLAEEAITKMATLNRPQDEVNRLKEKLLLFVRMVRSFIRKEYTDVPWKTILAIIAGILYFVTPIDLIPDFIPITGFVDDFTVLYWVFNNFNKDIEEFRAWEQQLQ